MWSLAEIDQRRADYDAHKRADRHFEANPLSESDIRRSHRATLIDIGVFIRTVLDRPNPFGWADFVESGFIGPNVIQEAEDDFAYVRFQADYGHSSEHEVCRVGKSYAGWLAGMGVAVLVTETEAATEGAYVRKFVKRSEPFTRAEAMDHLGRELARSIERAQSVIDALADDEITTLSNEHRWSEVGDLIGWGEAGTIADPLPPLFQFNGQNNVYEFSLGRARLCVGGPYHGDVYSNIITYFGPDGYQPTQIMDSGRCATVWRHDSVDDEHFIGLVNECLVLHFPQLQEAA